MTVVRDAALLLAVSIGLSAGVNALRADGLPWVRHTPYDILVPCPEAGGEAAMLAPGDRRVGAASTYLVDARGAEAFATWHLPGARNVPYDFLEPTPEAAVREAAASGAERVVVYGDGRHPDSGRELARELAGRGVRNVFHVTGGAPALRRLRDGSGAP